MRRLFIVVFLAFAALFAASATQPPSTLQVKGMGWGKCPCDIVLNDGDYWGGSIWLTLDGKEFLEGVWSGQDGTDTWAGPGEAFGTGKNGVYTYAFNKLPDGTYADTFVAHIPIATFSLPPGLMGFGTYQGPHHIVSGTGRFKHAKGMIAVSGTYVWGPAAGGTVEVGYFSPEYTGFINNVLPAK
ncbi:hypothetical protein [Geothrix sp. 21YS21S-2]|uniref:hypothetical protein n=1 Tax=Geothrix sp. 21YS21S-2 TaxID=3068893 RepID=UPI0027B994F3|nr:hypothetical protein [Geothrix sp. 21YS21S-2]